VGVSRHPRRRSFHNRRQLPLTISNDREPRLTSERAHTLSKSPLAGASKRGTKMEKHLEQATESPVHDDFAELVTGLLERAHLDFERDRHAASRFLPGATLLEGERTRQKSHEPTRQRGGLSGWQVKKIRAFIDERLNAPIRISELRDLAQLSTGHFYRAFKQAFNQTPHRYLMVRRVERARKMMLDTSESLADISLACGFTDQAHLSKLFKNEFCQSPAAWRRTLHEPL